MGQYLRGRSSAEVLFPQVREVEALTSPAAKGSIDFPPHLVQAPLLHDVCPPFSHLFLVGAHVFPHLLLKWLVLPLCMLDQHLCLHVSHLLQILQKIVSYKIVSPATGFFWGSVNLLSHGKTTWHRANKSTFEVQDILPTHPSGLPLTQRPFVKFSLGPRDTEGVKTFERNLGLNVTTEIDYSKHHNACISQVQVQEAIRPHYCKYLSQQSGLVS